MFEDDDRNAVFVESTESDISTELIEQVYHTYHLMNISVFSFLLIRKQINASNLFDFYSSHFELHDVHLETNVYLVKVICIQTIQHEGDAGITCTVNRYKIN